MGGENPPLAHPENDRGEVHDLANHLEKVALMAAGFAAKFGGEKDAHLAGLLHDLGKARREFQEYLLGKRKKGLDTQHALFGGYFSFLKQWLVQAFAILGHHAGLPDKHDLKDRLGTGLNPLLRNFDALRSMGERLIAGDATGLGLQSPGFVRDTRHLESLEFYVRMVFSCLVDADFLDTESHFTGSARTPCKMIDWIDQFLARLENHRRQISSRIELNLLRDKIFQHACEAGSAERGFFSLTVPTGGGKTLSAMAFALAHAKKHYLDRIIVVIPFLSIIEQNAAIYRRILDPDGLGLVLEHHSAVDPDAEESDDQASYSLKLAAENWDAPIVVTTTVQFVESLFASRPARCRKLHNVARSVILFDEVQTLPVHLLESLLDTLRQLTRHYGCSLLFGTATQPGFAHHPVTLPAGFQSGEVTEIAPEPGTLFARLKRVEYENLGAIDWDALAEKIAEEKQALCVVNVRGDARRLWELVRDHVDPAEKNSVMHLSSCMCPDHRLAILGSRPHPNPDSILGCLARQEPCRVISTQVIEAGVDVDFPVVFRATGPLDSLVQAAGRCNREGKLVNADGRPIPGRVILFQPEKLVLPPGIYRKGAELTALRATPEFLAKLPTDPGVFRPYFSSLYQVVDTDGLGRDCPSLMAERRQLNFRVVDQFARVIKEDGRAVVVPFGSAMDKIQVIRERRPPTPRFTRDDLRSLQRSMVNLRFRDFSELQQKGFITPLLPNLEVFVLDAACYHTFLGIIPADSQKPLEDFLV